MFSLFAIQLLFECLHAALQVLFESLFRPTWRLLESSLAQLGRSWPSLGANLEPLGRLLEPTWTLLDTSWLHLGFQIVLQAPLGLHLCLQTGLQPIELNFGFPNGHLSTLQAPYELLSRTLGGASEAARAATPNKGPCVVPKGLLCSTAVHHQHMITSPDGDICNTSNILFYII